MERDKKEFAMNYIQCEDFEEDFNVGLYRNRILFPDDLPEHSIPDRGFRRIVYTNYIEARINNLIQAHCPSNADINIEAPVILPAKRKWKQVSVTQKYRTYDEELRD